MKAYELISWLEKKYPASTAEEWDNVGLLVGNDEKEISHIFLALDLTEEDENHVQGFGRVGRLPHKMTLREYACLVKESLKLGDVKVYGDLEKEVERAAICTGSGKSMIQEAIAAGADVYVTGDIDHHTGIDTVAQGLAIIDAGHYGTEYIFMDAMKKELKEAFSSLNVTCAEVKSPYTII